MRSTSGLEPPKPVPSKLAGPTRMVSWPWRFRAAMQLLEMDRLAVARRDTVVEQDPHLLVAARRCRVRAMATRKHAGAQAEVRMAAVRFRGTLTIGYFGSSHGEHAKSMD